MKNINLDGKNTSPDLDKTLASFAQKNCSSGGRVYLEPADPDRTPFQRDRDRIIHSSAFRRLAGKMQVVNPAQGDHFRNRLTHTLEVAQISRDIARQLKLNEDLAEAIALAHDLGHPPFGHAGESALNLKMNPFGKSFEHNAQSLRVVEFFEQRYREFPGLNLTLEVKEGMQKHSTFFDRPEGDSIYSPHLEAQVVDMADEIAYLSADLDDGIRGGFFEVKDLVELEICSSVVSQGRESRSEIVRGVIRFLLSDLVAQARINIEKYKIRSLADVQKTPEKIIQLSPSSFEQFRALKNFLFKRYYSAPSVKSATEEGQTIISHVFDYFLAHPENLPKYLRETDSSLEIKVCDYIAGMTDRFLWKWWEEVSD